MNSRISTKIVLLNNYIGTDTALYGLHFHLNMNLVYKHNSHHFIVNNIKKEVLFYIVQAVLWTWSLTLIPVKASWERWPTSHSNYIYTVTYLESAKLLFIENKVSISTFVPGAFHKVEHALYRIKQAFYGYILSTACMSKLITKMSIVLVLIYYSQSNLFEPTDWSLWRGNGASKWCLYSVLQKFS